MNKTDSLKKKIKYRSEYRGIKEMDLILGKFVEKYVDTFTHDELADLYKILDIDDDILFKWYSNLEVDNHNSIPRNKVSSLLKNFKL